MFSKFSNVVCINIDGKNLKDPKVISDINKQVEAKVKVIVNELKTTHAKFVDVDFGPKEDDEFGATSLYGPANKTPEPAGSKYPSPDTLRWDRPLYDDDNFEEDEEKKDGSDDEDQAGGDDVYGEGEGNDDEFGDDNFAFQGGDDDQDGPWCKHGSLFIDGASSGDVIQGTLGDCWFLGAMAVMGANESLLKDCFWNADSFKNYGLFVVRFFKDVQIIYVIIDDRIPVKIKDGRVIFGSCKDPNELWVPLMEKAYAKLHGSYRGLIAGWLHHGLSDMTGYCSKLVTLKPGYPGYNEKLDADEVWNLIERYKSWGCLMGTSIQADHRQERKVEMEAGMGLLMGHAYSFLGLGSIDDANAPGGHVRLVKLRNPWGRGEWEGAYGDRTEERERAEIQNEIEKNFKVGHEDITINFMDGSFFMPFDAWFSRFTSLMVAVNFPNHWFGRRLQGFWSGEKGGNRNMGSWISNDKIKMNIKGEKGTYKHVFIGLYTHDSRLTLGKEYYLDPVYSCPLAFDVVTANDFDKDPKERQIIPGSSKHLPTLKKPAQPMHQAPYNNGDTQIECYLQAGVDYFILPFLYNRQQPGAYYITVYAENDFELEGGVKVSGESQLMVVGAKVSDAVKASHVSVDVNAGDKTTAHWSNPQAVLDSMPDARLTTTSNSSSEALVTVANKEKVLSISKAQFYEKAEQLRSRFVLEAKRLGVSLAQVKSIFASDRDVSGKDMKRSTYSQFKRRLMDIGFSLTDLPDEDLVVLDIDNSGSISPNEFLDFFELGLSFDEGVNMPIPPPPPVDDLLFKAADLEGVLRVNVIAGRAMRQPAAWFQKSTDGETNSKYEDKATTSQSSSGTEGSNEFKDRKVLQYHKEGRKFCYENIFHDHSSSSSTAAAANSASSNSKQDNHGNEEVKIADNTPDSPIHGTVALNNTKKINSGGSISGGSTMTTTSKRAGENIAQNSGIQLHTDPELVEAEIQRALLMQSFRKTLQNG